MDAQALNDALTILAQRTKDFKAEGRDKARTRQLYFVQRGRLIWAVSGTRNTLPVPADASPDVPPEGIDAAKWRRLLELLSDAEKLLRDELKLVPASQPLPKPLPVPDNSGRNATERMRKRRRSRDALEATLKDVYGKKDGKFRFRQHEKLLSTDKNEAWLIASYHPDLKVFFYGEQVPMAMAETASASGTTPRAQLAQRMRRMHTQARLLASRSTALQPAEQPPAQGGAIAWLWPGDKPVYKRPGAIIGAASILGVVGWLLFAPKKTEKKPAAEGK